MRVIKNSGINEEFNIQKIKKAIELANGRSIERLIDKDIVEVLEVIDLYIYNIEERGITTLFVNDIHDIIIKTLKDFSLDVAEEYSKYRNYKKRFNKTFNKVVTETSVILNNGDKENANKDSTLISTQKELISGVVSKNMVLDNELKEEWANAHKEGLIQIHDLTDYIFNSFNCCLFDMGKLLKGGFEINGIKKKEPNSVNTAISVMSDVILSASSQQFGGFTVPEVDKVLAPYVKKSFIKYKKMIESKNLNLTDVEIDKWVEELVYNDLRQGIESVEHRLNTINNSNGQTSFTTFSIGMDITKEGRMVTKAILEVRKEGLGENNITAIFPKLVFLYRDEVSGDGAINNDLYIKAIETTMVRMYPDYLSLDIGYLGEVYDKYNKVISPMGCRSFLSVWLDDKGEAVFEGRANCGVVSLNLPRFALESGKHYEIGSEGHINAFFYMMDYYLDMAIQLHLYRFEKMRKKKASSNPLFFTQGGCHIKLNPNDVIEEAIKTFTWSIGYIGLDEVSRYLVGKGVHIDNSFAKKVLEKLNSKIDEYKEKYGLLFSLYSTPAESMCYRLLKLDRERFGVIEGITDKEYYTNSFHIQVREKVNAIEKQKIEIEMFNLVTGGRIIYNEFPNTKNFKAVKQIIDIAMKWGEYFGINLELDSCLDCGKTGEFKSNECPKCKSINILRVNRVCGYLGYRVRFNKGKAVETEERVDHFN